MSESNSSPPQEEAMQGLPPLPENRAKMSGEEKYCKELLEIAAPGGGFFLAPGAVIDQAKPENIHVFIEATKEYGMY